MTSVTLNGNAYSTDGSADRDMQGSDGYGYQTWLIPMFSDSLTEMATRTAAVGSSLSSTSTTSLSIGTGSKSLTVSANKAFAAGQTVMIAVTADVTQYMFGAVSSYNSTTGALVVSVSDTAGSGTYAAWTVSLVGPKGATGGASLPAGSAAAPGLAVVGDANTGLAQVGGADTISMVAGGVEALRASSNGTVTMTALSASNRADITGTDPTFCLTETDAGTDAKKWDCLPIAGILNYRLVNDNYSAAYTWMAVSRVGVTSARMAFGATATAKQATVAYASTITLDFSSQDYVIGDLTGPLTLANPSSYPVGQRGEILIHEDGTGGRTVSFGANWIKIGKDTVNTAAGKYSVITYWIVASSVVIYSIAGGA